jgi:lathosterol oxidase
MEIASFSINLPALFAIIFGRYLLISFLAQKFFPPLRAPATGQISREIRYSIFTSLLFALAGAVVLEGWKLGWLPVYFEIAQYGWGYFIGSILLLIFLHETYFYFTHRLLHLPWLYRQVHFVHHQSKFPTAYASFAFHPVEGLVEAAVLPLLFLAVPLHPAALLIFLAFMSILGATNHLGREIYPQNTPNHWFGKWWIGPTHHGQHHERVHGNYGLYFTFWDRLLKTEFADYPEQFAQHKQQQRNVYV